MALADLTVERMEKEMTAIMILSLKQKHRATLLSTTYDKLEPFSPFRSVDEEIYGVYQKAAQADPKFSAHNLGVISAMVATFTEDGLEKLEAKWGSADCPPAGDEAAEWLLA